MNPEIEITLDDVRLILGKRFDLVFKRATESVYCPGCKKMYTGSIVIHHIWLNQIGDIALEGVCKDCGHAVGRYLETGEDPDSYDQAMAIRELKIEVLRDYKLRR